MAGLKFIFKLARSCRAKIIFLNIFYILNCMFETKETAEIILKAVGYIHVLPIFIIVSKIDFLFERFLRV